MVALPIEVWGRILSHLLVPLPSNNNPLVENRADYAQPDLCCTLRVNSAFHYAAAPLLYVHPIVFDLPSFLLGFNAKHPHRQSKRDLLTLTRTLKLVNPSPAISEDIILRLSFLGWKGIVENDQKVLDRLIRNSLDPIIMLGAQHLGGVSEKEEESILRGLEKVVICSKNEYLWILLERGSPKYVQDLLTSARRIVPLLVRSSTSIRAKWYQYVSHGPYALDPSALIDLDGQDRGKLVHHEARQGTTTVPRFVNDWENRIILPPVNPHQWEVGVGRELVE